MPSDDELARTATAPSPPAPAGPPIRTMLGRFEVERILGQGGMGVVYAAFDPELQRRVALKVLRHAATPDSRARLLREARAMAKLSHPHVITVFEVGSAADEDFVAMELIDGETLGDWIRRTRPRWREILAAFIAAGRGLAAAHAEGLVHRDFKPNNVLRSHAGRIVVTDFGLARSAEDPESAGDAAAPGAVTRTQTGAVLGTPAYMAPEQWAGAAVESPSDQFAFCVALWEALAGERPYRGTTIEEIRSGALAGPAELTADAIPRSLRASLRRGLATDPAQRWASMDTLLGELVRILGRQRRRSVATAAAVAVCGIAALVVVAGRDREADCTPPIDPAAVWSPARVAAFAARGPEAAKLVGDDLATWRAVRPRACAATAQRSARLACLDAVLERLGAAVGAAERDGQLDADALGAVLVDPAMCDRATPPQLVAMTPALADAFGLLRRAIIADPRPDDAAFASLADHGESPCVQAIAVKARLEGRDPDALPGEISTLYRDMQALADLGGRCGDAAIKAVVAVDVADPNDASSVDRAETAVAAFPQDDLRAALEVLHADRARAAERRDEVWSQLDHALALFATRHRARAQLEIVAREIRLAVKPGRPEDLARVDALIARWRPLASGLGPRAAGQFDAQVARYRWGRGEVAVADTMLADLLARGVIPDPAPPIATPPIDVTGEVVDDAGAPVRGAEVIAAFALIGDSATLGTPMFDFGAKRVKTDAAGRFAIAAAHGWVAAQAEARRSSVTAVEAHVHLVLRPTGHVEGSVARGAIASRRWVVARSEGAGVPTIVIAPVLADGRFSLDGLPRGKVVLSVNPADSMDVGSDPHHLVVGDEPIRDLRLATSGQRLYVIARSSELTRPDGALVWVYPRYVEIAHPTLNALGKLGLGTTPVMARPADPKQQPPELASVGADDLVATIADRPAGEIMVCALGFAKKQMAGVSLVEFGTAMVEVELACLRVAADQSTLTIDLPALRKIPTRK